MPEDVGITQVPAVNSGRTLFRGPLFPGLLGVLGGFWTPIFRVNFPLFLGLLKSAFARFQIGCMTHFKVGDGQVPIADTTREPALFGIFNWLYIRVFRSPFSGISPVMDFRPLLAEALFYWVFCNSSAVLGLDFWR
jgi:hypothetical protein